MGAVSVGNTSFSSVILSPLQNDNAFLSCTKNNKKPLHNLYTVSRCRLLKFGKVSCTVTERGIKENPTSKGEGSKKMEDYNTAMKRMMRNPYEYHHDLGQFPLFSYLPIFVLLVHIFRFISILFIYTIGYICLYLDLNLNKWFHFRIRTDIYIFLIHVNFFGSPFRFV